MGRVICTQNIKEYESMVKLNLSESERKWVSDIADMLTGSFGALEGVDTSGAEPLVTVLDIRNVLREDVSAKMLSREELLANAPEQYDGYFQVPKTLE